jgi:hypothetical protein
MLQDLPGGGKTVVMRDVLISLEENGYPVLAIKADWLSGIQTRSDLADRLGLPVPVEECARIMVTEGPFVVLFDQLDALSLALSRTQATLDVMLSTLARLRSVENVKIIASCRVFELRNDPQLSAIKMDQRFKLQSLDKPQVHQILDKIGIDPARLLPEHRELIAIPLHLNIYARIIGENTPSGTPESFHTLQDLYEVLWQRRIMVVPPEKPSLSTRREAIYRLVHEMQSNRRLSAPVAALDEYPKARRYLEQEGYIRREGGNWLFAHQTLFDYCYARRFIAERKSLHQEILSGPQGLFERSQMVQVLAHLRGVDGTLYLQELNSLLFSDDLRIHLRLLLIAWFGALPDPTADEMRIARRLMCAADDKARFLQAVSGNEGWFDALAREIVPSLLRSDTARDIELVTRYLGTMIEKRTSDVLDHLHPFLGNNSDWDTRIAFCLSHLDHWRSDKALEMLCNLFQRGRAGSRGEHCLFKLARANPAAGCQALRAYLDRQLDDLLAQDKQETLASEMNPAASDQMGISSHFHWNRVLLGEHTARLIIGTAAQECPEAVIEHLLPWFIRVAVALTRSVKSDDEYPWEPLFSSGWYNEHLLEGAEFAQHLVQALRWVAHKNPPDFRKIARRLAAVESMATQRVLAQAYLYNPEMYADDIFEYLTADPRRLRIGEEIGASPHYDSRRMYAAAFQRVNINRRAVLEQLVLDLQPEWEQKSLRHRGITQLGFLKTVPPDLLGGKARDLLGELERKFPDFELGPPAGYQFTKVGPPIETEAQAKMSNDAWLGAMRRYDDSTAWDAPEEEALKGGVVELSRAFAEQVKSDPRRFYQLARQQFDETISTYYIEAAISGLAESSAPAEWVFDLTRQFAPRIEGEFRRGVCRALEKRFEFGVPDDLLSIVVDWALNDPDPEGELWRTPASSGEPYYGGDPYQHGINTNRGAAVRTVCRCAMKREPPQVERTFELLEQAADDPSTAVRTCVIESLRWILNEDANRALAIFERTLDSHPRLLQRSLTHRFLYWTYRDHFGQIRPLIETLLSNDDDSTRRSGAILACLAAFRHPEAEELADQAMQGDPAMRRGAAQVYARNLEHHDLEEVCREPLVQLMYDTHNQVRREVGQCFTHLRAEHLDRRRPFIEKFIDSPALMDGAEHLVEYLAPLAADAPDLALNVTERILEVADSEITDMHGSASILEQDLVRLPLTVYTHSFNPEQKSRAMGLFESLLLLGSRSAHQALEDWDRR